MRPNSFATEQRMTFKENSNQDVVVLSGYAFFTDSPLKGNDDDAFANHNVEMTVGPIWRQLDDVSPLVVRSWLNHPDSDVDDGSGYFIEECTWEEEEGRILLKARVGVRGENASVKALAYQVTAVGAIIGNLNEPGPAA